MLFPTHGRTSYTRCTSSRRAASPSDSGRHTSCGMQPDTPRSTPDCLRRRRGRRRRSCDRRSRGPRQRRPSATASRCPSLLARPRAAPARSNVARLDQLVAQPHKEPALTFADSVQYSTISRCLPGRLAPAPRAAAGLSPLRGHVKRNARGAHAHVLPILIGIELDPLPQTGAPAPGPPGGGEGGDDGRLGLCAFIELAAQPVPVLPPAAHASAASRASRSRASARWRVRSSRLRRSTVGGADSFAAAAPGLFRCVRSLRQQARWQPPPGNWHLLVRWQRVLMDTPLV